MADLETSLVTLLNTISYKAYPLQKPQDKPLPAMTYTRITTNLEQAQNGPTNLSLIRMQITCAAETYATAKAVATTLRSTMASATTFGNQLKDQQEFVDPDGIYTIVHDYEIWTDKE